MDTYTHTEESYRNEIHKLIADQLVALDWTLEKANKTFKNNYWEKYRLAGNTPQEALDIDYWGDKSIYP